MAEIQELFLLVLGLAALAFLLARRRALKAVPGGRLLMLVFAIQLLAWLFTNLESFFLFELMNVLEHVSQAVAGLLIAVWCVLAWRRGELGP